MSLEMIAVYFRPIVQWFFAARLKEVIDSLRTSVQKRIVSAGASDRAPQPLQEHRAAPQPGAPSHRFSAADKQ